MRTLLLMRHAKSAYPDGVADHDRPLAARGVKEAALAGEWLRSNTGGIDAVLCSSAARASETLTRANITAPVRYVDRLYAATPGTIIEEINQVDDHVHTLLLIGHEPAMGQVTLGLAGADGTESAAAERVSAKFPTSAIAVLQLGEPWRLLELGGAALIDFHVPR